MIKVGIIGATGYAGGELVRILTGHKDAEIVWYGSRSYIDKKYADVYQNMFQIVDATCLDCSILTAYPLAKEGLIDMDTLIIDAKSGTSGAGSGAKSRICTAK